MRKLLIKLTTIILVVLSSVIMIQAITQQSSITVNTDFRNFNYIETMMLESSRYTQSEAVDQERLDFYYNEQTFYPEQSYLDKYGYISYPELEDEYIKVYIDQDSFNVIVYDKQGDYYYSSKPEFQGFDSSEGNITNRRLINSGIWIDYVSTTKPEQSSITTMSLYSFAEVEFLPTSEYPVTPKTPYELKTGSYKKDKVNVKLNELIDGKAVYNIKINNRIEISFDVEIYLNNGDLSFKIPNETITEDTTNYSTLAISIFPYFGATRKDFVPGYMIIPDGVGALIRLDKPNDTTFYGRFYGDDNGYAKTYNNHLSVPLFGIIHEHNQTGFYAHVSEGSEQVILSAHFYGRTNYNRLTSKYYLREMTRRIIDRAGSGSDMIYTHKTNSSYQINYTFLNDDEANYVGAANHYRDYLLKEELVNKQIFKDDIDLYLSILLGDNEPALFGQRRITMTKASEALTIYNELKQLGIENQVVNLMGYSKDGAAYSIVKMNYQDSTKDHQRLASQISKDDNTLLLTQNYAISLGSKRVSNTKDVAKSINRLKMSYTRRERLFDDSSTLYYLYPEQSYQKAASDLKFINKHSVGMQINDIGSYLFSTYDKTIADRNVGMAYYKDIVGLYDTVMLSNPNSYLWGDINGYTNMSITNSQYGIYTDLVPLIPIILQGIMPKYTPYLNFNATGKERLLQMVDFNLYPSFIVTEEDTFKMRYTSSRNYYSTKYELYKDDIVTTYNYLNDALKHISEAKLLKREVIQTGLIKNTYDNGVTIYINYTSNDITTSGIVVSKMDYKVII